MKQIGWIMIDPKEAKNVMDAWGMTDIKRVAARLAWVSVTGQSITNEHPDIDFIMGDYTIRLNVQTANRDMLVPEEIVDHADIHVMVYWNDFAMIFFGWQWGKVISKNTPRKAWDKSSDRKYFHMAVGGLRDMGDLMERICPEKMTAISDIPNQGKLI